MQRVPLGSLAAWLPVNATAQSSARPPRAAFSLIELLLTVVIILLLFGAMAVSLSPWQQSAALEEGAERFAAIVQLARAQAAETGRTVLLQFNTQTNDLSGLSHASVELLWEPDPLGQPETYLPLSVPGWDMSDLNSLVGVVKVSELTTRARANSAPAAETGPVTWPPLHFFADGSSDSAEVQLASREDPGGLRQMVVRLVGMTGSVSYHSIDVDSTGSEITDETAAAFDDWEDSEEPSRGPASPTAAGQTF